MHKIIELHVFIIKLPSPDVGRGVGGEGSKTVAVFGTGTGEK
jgi:hypothetical protein